MRKVKPKENIAPRFGIHNLRPPKGAHKKRKIKGRGPSSGHGKTSTRGSKGQTSRSGRATYPGFEGGQTPIIRRIPKRGFTNKSKKEFQIVNLRSINTKKVTVVNPEWLLAEGLIKSKTIPVKILGDGELKNPLTVSAHAFSEKAIAKIKNSGGNFEVIK